MGFEVRLIISKMSEQILKHQTIEQGAIFSEDRKFRYEFHRFWNQDPKMLWVLTNPSIADEIRLDPTQVRITDFSKRLGFGGNYSGNLLARVSTDPRPVMKDILGSIGPENDEHILAMEKKTKITCLGYGCWKKRTLESKAFHKRALDVLRLLEPARTFCLAVTRDNCPRHPLYLKHTLVPIPYFELP